MTRPTLSICVPTYNRAGYLRCLLEHFVQDAGRLKHSYEILIGDNASPDDTETVVTEFLNKLPIRYFRRERNYGGDGNMQLLRMDAEGIFQVYLADDDNLIFPQLNAILDRLIATPGIGVVFAPWVLYDRVGKQVNAIFYNLEKDVIIEKGNYPSLLSLILKDHVFPEHYIMRSDLVPVVAPFHHPLAYWAFVNTAEYCAHTRIWFRKEPFYVSITRYFENEENRGQLGHAEVQEGWDRYRGGLEYLVSRVFTTRPDMVTMEIYQSYLVQMQKFIAMRLHVALRLRIMAKRDPIDTYYLANRLLAMGFANLLPIPLEEIRYQAAAHYILHYAIASYKIDKVICVGNIPERFIQMLNERATLPVQRAESFNPENHANATILLPASVMGMQRVPAHRHLRVVGFQDVLQKFA